MNFNNFLQFVLSLLGQHSNDNPVVNSTPNQILIKDLITKIKVNRNISNTHGQFDTIQILNGDNVIWSGVVGENNILPNLPIQAGQYHIQWYDSPNEGYKDIVLINVPLHNFIECHIGNFPNSNPKHPSYGDSKGCLLIGTSLDDLNNPTMVCNSSVGFNDFKSHLPEDLSNVILEIA